MKGRWFATWVVACGCTASVVAMSASGLSSARAGAQASADALDRARSRAQTIVDLRARLGPGAALVSARPSSTLPTRLGVVLAARGLPSTTLASFSSAATHAGPHSGDLPHQEASIVLANLGLPDLGGFLAAWKQAEPGWVVTSVELSPDQASKKDATSGRPRGTSLRVIIQMRSAVPTQQGSGP